jgi:flagellar biosynthesis GTPase FlhF
MEGEVAAVPISVAAEVAAPAAEVVSSVAASTAEGAAGATANLAEAAARVTSELSPTGASLAGEAGTAVESAGSVAEAVDHPLVGDVAGLEDLVEITRGKTATKETNADRNGSADAPGVEAASAQPNAAPGEETPAGIVAEPSGTLTQEAAAQPAESQASKPTEAQTAEARAQRTQELTDKVRSGDATEQELTELNSLNRQAAREEEHRALKERVLRGEPLSDGELAKLNSYEANGTPGQETQTPRAEGVVAPEGTEQPEIATLRTQVEGLSRQVAELQAFINILKPTLETLLAKQVAEEKDPEKKTMWQMMLNIIKALVLSAVIETTGTVKGSVVDQAK